MSQLLTRRRFLTGLVAKMDGQPIRSCRWRLIIGGHRRRGRVTDGQFDIVHATLRRGHHQRHRFNRRGATGRLVGEFKSGVDDLQLVRRNRRGARRTTHELGVHVLQVGAVLTNGDGHNRIDQPHPTEIGLPCGQCPQSLNGRELFDVEQCVSLFVLGLESLDHDGREPTDRHLPDFDRSGVGREDQLGDSLSQRGLRDNGRGEPDGGREQREEQAASHQPSTAARTILVLN